jgi:DNA polymerase IV
VRGQDDRSVEPERVRKSVGKETTFERDVEDQAELLSSLEDLAEQVEHRLAALGIAGKTITLKLRWDDFRNVSRSSSTSQPIQSAQAMMCYLRPQLLPLLLERKSVRLLGVTLSHLVAEEEMKKHEQMSEPTLWDLSSE